MRIGINARILRKGKLEGVGRFCYETIRSLASQFPQHHFILFIDRLVEKDEYYFGENTTYVPLFWPARHPFLYPFFFEWSLPRALKRHQCDVLYSPDGYISLCSKLPSVLVMHDLAYLHFPKDLPLLSLKYYQWFFPRYLHKAKSIVTVSQYVKEDIVQQFPAIDGSKISVAHNALPSEFHLNDAPRSHEISFPYFVVVGSLNARKNITTVLQAFALYKKKYPSNHKLLFVGKFMWGRKDALSVSLEKAVKSGEVIINQGVSEAELKSVIENSLALVYVSKFEGFGIPILEGFASKVPVITSNVTSMPEVAGDAAVLVDPFDVDAIADSMHLVLEPKIRQELIAKGTKRVAQFSWSTTAIVIMKTIENTVV